MLAARNGFKQFKFNFSLDFVLAEICSPDLNLVPPVGSSFPPFDFALVDRCPLANSQVPVDDEEAKIVVGHGCNRVENGDF